MFQVNPLLKMQFYLELRDRANGITALSTEITLSILNILLELQQFKSLVDSSVVV